MEVHLIQLHFIHKRDQHLMLNRHLFNIFTTLLNLNLDAYIGQPNMRIKFTYFSNNTDSLWVLDNITIPQAPVGLTTEMG